ncbi:primosomal protein N' [Olsenella sp. DSM 107455]|uniref:Replication restart protein PriA n=1 Tax=Thermophilibacter gallinarum TaxID=2779357 RepID=A0ABR9QSD2_9ACTN|nr:primosomal protein N' [Thermophilibacter gallinarum]MBE5023981.1 primosomal protein N' [Thermophilibacter gallinarum]
MPYASVVLDIPTRALDAAFDYAVPSELAADAVVGATVLVTFANRAAVGYVVAVRDEPSAGVAPEKIRAVEQVLAPSAFDDVAARVAAWMAREYACPPAEAVRPFLAPGQKVRVTRAADDAPWELQTERTGAVDDRWAALTPAANDYEPVRSASRQRAVIEALRQGPQRVAELSATIPGAAAAVTALAKRGVVDVTHRRRVRGTDDTTLSSAAAPRPERLTDGQLAALDAIERARTVGRGDVVLVDGVTGSGKTEVYLAAIERALADGRGALVLVPEISLTAQTVGRFRSRFGDEVAVLHSRLSAGERFDQWDLVRSGRARVVVGARSALFAPLADPGLIIIDEEHEGSYKQDKSPRYHAREVAAELARARGAALVLGSATPSLESLARCRAGEFRGVRWTRVEMRERPGGARLPEVTVADMAEQFRGGGRSVFSAPLADALLDVARRREKAVLLLNRRGFANFLMCRECGCVPECPHCSCALTYHERGHRLVCHSCGRSWPVRAFPDPTTSCPNCGSRYLAAYGVGTQRVEDELRMLLPDHVEVIRMDADSTRAKGAHQELLERFDAAECAVLVGTQMIAKGLDFPEVTLVGVINADTVLKLPDFRAAERTYDLLEQVAGRAGRGERPGRVIVQTYWASHPAIRAVAAHDRAVFLDAELAERAGASYPPFSRLANVTVWGRAEKDVRAVTDELAAALRARLGDAAGWEVLGPADCLRARAKDQFRRHVMVKAPADADLGGLLGSCAASIPRRRGINMAVDVDAYDMM